MGEENREEDTRYNCALALFTLAVACRQSGFSGHWRLAKILRRTVKRIV